MYIKSTIIATLLLVTGCKKDPLIFDNEPLTGVLCCKTHANYLETADHTMNAELILKISSEAQEAHDRKKAIQAVFMVETLGKKTHHFTPTDHLILTINGTSYPVNVIHTINTPKTISVQNPHYIAGSKEIRIAYVTDLTLQTLLLLFPYDILEKLAHAQEAELTVSTHNKPTTTFHFSPHNIQIVKTFKETCVDQQPIKETKK